MSDLQPSGGPFEQLTRDSDRLQRLIERGLHGVDDGELFLEYRETESFAFDDGRLKTAAFDTSRGLGLRAVAGEAIGLAHSPSSASPRSSARSTRSRR